MSDFVIKNGHEWPQIIPAATGDVDLDSINLLPATGDRVLIYVRLTGDDTTGDGTIDNPYATVERAIEDLPSIWFDKRYIIDVSDLGTVIDLTGKTLQNKISNVFNTAFTSPEFSKWTSEAPLTFQAVPTLIDTPGAPSGSAQDSITGFFTYTFAGATWDVDEFKNMWLVGTAAQEIIGNTADTITVASAAVNNSPFEVYDASTTFHDTTGAGGWLILNMACSTLFRGIRFTTAAPGSVQLLAQQCKAFLTYDMCEVQNPFTNGCNTTSFTRSNTLGGTFLSTSSVAFQNSFVEDFSVGGDRTAFTFTQSVLDNPAVNTGQLNCSVTIDRLLLVGPGGLHHICPELWTINRIKLDGVIGNGITCDGPGRTTIAIAGVGVAPTEYGLRVKNGHLVEITNALYAITGEQADMKVGYLPERSLASFLTSPPLKNEFDATTDGSRVWRTDAIEATIGYGIVRALAGTPGTVSGASVPAGTVMFDTVAPQIYISNGAGWLKPDGVTWSPV